MNHLENYLRELRDIRYSGAGVKETSYYGALANLLNEVGKTLKPKIRCIINLRNQGGGIPDGGLFTADQFQKSDHTEPLAGTLPARGAIEVKGTGDDAGKIADSDQVKKYLAKYGQVLVTNLRDFVLVGKDGTHLESYRLAADEKSFWTAAANPEALAKLHAERFTEYLKRVMLSNAPLENPKDVAWFLASYARDAKARIELAPLDELATIRAALEEALGVKFEGEKGLRFFRSTLVQTLFYGVFSAWVLWCKTNVRNPDSTIRTPFDWYSSARYLRVPILRKLFHLISEPGQLDELNLSEALDWAAAALNRVNHQAFFAQFNEGEAVQYFYEPFLEAFDPELRKELGVWYTPIEIVKYMVERVDTVLRTELNRPDGLADPDVYVLDPCCGTGAYLVEVINKIAATLREKGDDALLAADLKKAAMERVFGFEILPAPFVVAHLQIGLLLQHLGATLDKKDDRAAIYLTNALTGWEPPKAPKTKLLFPELEEERDAAEQIKRDKPILVILGNPPYNAFAGVSPEEEQGLVEPYKIGLQKDWGIKKFNLDDLYIRFFRLAERRIAEKTGQGIVCFVSNFSYLSDPSFVVMRQKFLSEFDAMWFDSLNGDSRETGKLTPDGKSDPSVFSTQYNKEGIRVGTSIGLMVRKQKGGLPPTIHYQEFWGVTKRENLLASLDAENFDAQYQVATPTKDNRFSFRHSNVEAQYLRWPKLVELCEDQPISGLQEMRKGGLMSITRESLEGRMQRYFDVATDWQTLKLLGTGLCEDGGGFVAAKAREKAQSIETYDKSKIVRYALYPFDIRWSYYSTAPLLWNRPRPNLKAQNWDGNKFIVTRMVAERPNEQITTMMTSALPDYHLLRPNAVAIPIRLRPTFHKKGKTNAAQNLLFGSSAENELQTIANLNSTTRGYLSSFGINDVDENVESASLIWYHALAIGYAPLYLSENADGIRQDWPRIPLPANKDALCTSAELGKQIAALLDTETPVVGVTSGTIRPELKTIAVIAHAEGKQLSVEDLQVTAGWGHGGKGGITMPGKGKAVSREITEQEKHGIPASAWLYSGEKYNQAEAGIPNTFDIHLNNFAYWRNVPERVWEYTIGGYQVMKKWLSYRELELLGRALTIDEVREVSNMARRIAAILLLETQLDENYRSVKAKVYEWERKE